MLLTITTGIVPPPVCVAGATSEDDGWVLVTVHDAASDKGKLVILDAKDLSQGPVATLHLPHFLPAGLHGSWCPQVFDEGSDAVPKWREPNVVRGL
jgi:all-trans-8'-apo-beta-carotenal 15,15'-oxygenase